MKIRLEGRSPPWLQHRVEVNPMTDYDARIRIRTEINIIAFSFSSFTIEIIVYTHI
ncbi:hypothetical protein HanIR_Chr11g0532641 [Helianthus annuus]|nr:hypothetical protein HanIR_Chr11g0532641 [Helianthus annuus]